MIRDHCYPKCGDGVRVPHESCDDGNTQELQTCWCLRHLRPARCAACVRRQDGDGCSSRCRIELGYACHGGNTTHVDNCRLTVCGDGVVEASRFIPACVQQFARVCVLLSCSIWGGRSGRLGFGLCSADGRHPPVLRIGLLTILNSDPRCHCILPKVHIQHVTLAQTCIYPSSRKAARVRRSATISTTTAGMAVLQCASGRSKKWLPGRRRTSWSPSDRWASSAGQVAMASCAGFYLRSQIRVLVWLPKFYTA